MVFVVNHSPLNNFEKETVEKFSYDMQSNTLRHMKTYSDDHFTL